MGLSIDDITEIYSRYGASTKRGTNEQTGMLGLGSKSALTYATQFTMTAVKDGVRSEVLISVKVDGSGKMEVMDTVTTTEGNGVRITIPTKPQNNFAEKASKFFQYWHEGTVLVNGEQPETIGGKTEMTDIGDGMFITDTLRSWQTREQNDSIVMGGVPYPLPADYRSKLENVSRKYCVFYVPMGDVDFVPSREEVNLTPRTKDYLSNLIDRFIVNVGKTVAKEINGCTEFPEALAVATKWRSVGNFEQKQKFTFHGLDIPLYFERRHWLYDGTYQYGSRKQSKEYRASADKLGKSVFVHGYIAEGSPSKAIREKVWKWLENNSHDKRDIIIYADTDFVGAWSTAIKVDYADVKATKLPTAKSVSVGKVRTFDWDVVQNNGNLKEENLPDTTKVAYYSPTALTDNDYRSSSRSKLYAIAQASGYTLVEASAGRFARLCREIPNAITAQEMVKQYITAKTSVLSPRDIALYHHTSYGDVSSMKWQSAGVKDTRLIAEIDDYAKANKTVANVWSSVNDDSRIFGEHFSQASLLATDYDLSLAQYPLLKTIMGFGENIIDEVVVYLNAKYEMNN